MSERSTRWAQTAPLRKPRRPDRRQRMLRWLDDRLEVSAVARTIAEHPVPSHVNPAIHAPFAFVYCFGGLTFLFIALLITTGIFLTFYYVPSPDYAYYSVQYVMTEVTFGTVVRGIHHWSASAVVVMLVLHMLRVFLQGAYKPPRELNWIVGVFLFVIVLAFGFTGYLLPWDQRAYWATMVGTNMVGTVPVAGDFLLKFLRGGAELGAVSLARFYAIHIWLLPASLVLLLAGHFIMVRRQGISGPL